MDKFPYITQIHVLNSRVDQDFKIDIPPDDDGRFRHLILTGKNGSGKTTILESIDREYRTAGNFSPNYRPSRRVEKQNSAIQEHGTCELSLLGQPIHPEEAMTTFIRADRQARMSPVTGPQKMDIAKLRHTNKELAPYFRQFLVNMRTEQAYAREDGDDAEADRLASWFANLEEWFGTLFEDEGLKLEFDRTTFDFHFILSDGRRLSFDGLARGWSALVAIVAELSILHEQVRGQIPGEPVRGVVLIDEVETHLHLEMQRHILPFLTEVFPDVQFIAATHSPVVIASVPNAVVFDLTTKESITNPLGGYSYGTLAEEVFGLADKYPAYVAHLLERAGTLCDLAHPTPEDLEELARLVDDLQKLSPELALDAALGLERHRLGDIVHD